MSGHKEQASGEPEVTPTVRAELHPGDQAVPGTPSTGEDLCPECAGGGTLAAGGRCMNCDGTGKVIVPVSAGE